YGVLDCRENLIEYVNAGHCYPLVLKSGGSVERLDRGGTVLGFFPEAVYQRGICRLDPGDLLILYSDGVSELMNSREEEFGVDRILASLQSRAGLPMPEIKEALLRDMASHRQEAEA